MDFKVFKGYVFTKEDGAAEAVLYRYWKSKFMTKEFIDILPKDDSFYWNDEDVLKARIANEKISVRRKKQMKAYEQEEYSDPEVEEEER